MIKDGLGRDEFFLAYQPKVDMRCGRVVGFEALIRWQHSERGLLQPAEFVHLIEDHELVEDLGDWAIAEALRQAAVWLDQGVRTSVSMNISPRHLLRPDFVRRLHHHLGRYPQLPKGVLELTNENWAPFVKSLEHCIESQTMVSDIAGLHQPVDLIYGALDAFVAPGSLRVVERMRHVTTHRVEANDHIVRSRIAKVLVRVIDGTIEAGRPARAASPAR